MGIEHGNFEHSFLAPEISMTGKPMHRGRASILKVVGLKYGTRVSAWRKFDLPRALLEFEARLRYRHTIF